MSNNLGCEVCYIVLDICLLALYNIIYRLVGIFVSLVNNIGLSSWHLCNFSILGFCRDMAVFLLLNFICDDNYVYMKKRTLQEKLFKTCPEMYHHKKTFCSKKYKSYVHVMKFSHTIYSHKLHKKKT